MRLTKAEIKRSREYRQGTSADSLGDLHERMRCVRTLAQENRESIPSDLYQAIFDLETEVGFYVPAKPPYGQRYRRMAQQ